MTNMAGLGNTQGTFSADNDGGLLFTVEYSTNLGLAIPWPRNDPVSL